MLNGKKIIVVLPAYNAAKTLEKTVSELDRRVVDDILLVDDSSADETVKLAKKLGIRSFLHDKNYGYGRNQKTCYTEALKSGADVIVMLHPDYQVLAEASARNGGYGGFRRVRRCARFENTRRRGKARGNARL